MIRLLVVNVGLDMLEMVFGLIVKLGNVVV